MCIVCICTPSAKIQKNWHDYFSAISDLYVKPVGSYVSSRRCFMAHVECTKPLAAGALPWTPLGGGAYSSPKIIIWQGAASPRTSPQLAALWALPLTHHERKQCDLLTPIRKYLATPLVTAMFDRSECSAICWFSYSWILPNFIGPGTVTGFVCVCVCLCVCDNNFEPL